MTDDRVIFEVDVRSSQYINPCVHILMTMMSNYQQIFQPFFPFFHLLYHSVIRKLLSLSICKSLLYMYITLALNYSEFPTSVAVVSLEQVRQAIVTSSVSANGSRILSRKNMSCLFARAVEIFRLGTDDDSDSFRCCDFSFTDDSR